VTEIPTLPHAVDKTLIICMDRKNILSLNEIRRNIDLVVIVAIMICRSRTLRYKASVYVKLVIIV
jgi:hypothetical protein